MFFCAACACILPCMAFLRLSPYSWPIDGLNASKRNINACGNRAVRTRTGHAAPAHGKRQGYNLPKWWFLFACSVIRSRRTCTPLTSAGIFPGLFPGYPDLAAILARLFLVWSFPGFLVSVHIVPCFRLLPVQTIPAQCRESRLLWNF